MDETNVMLFQAGSPGLLRVILEHGRRHPEVLAEQEPALLAVLINKVASWITSHASRLVRPGQSVNTSSSTARHDLLLAT